MWLSLVIACESSVITWTDPVDAKATQFHRQIFLNDLPAAYAMLCQEDRDLVALIDWNNSGDASFVRGFLGITESNYDRAVPMVVEQVPRDFGVTDVLVQTRLEERALGHVVVRIIERDGVLCVSPGWADRKAVQDAFAQAETQIEQWALDDAQASLEQVRHGLDDQRHWLSAGERDRRMLHARDIERLEDEIAHKRETHIAGRWMTGFGEVIWLPIPADQGQFEINCPRGAPVIRWASQLKHPVREGTTVTQSWGGGPHEPLPIDPHWASQRVADSDALLARAQAAPEGTTLDLRLSNPSGIHTFRFTVDGIDRAMAHVRDLCPRSSL